MDGVIVDSNPFHNISIKQFCRQYGYSLSDEDLRERIYGRTNRDWIRNLFGNISDADVDRYTREKEELYRSLYANDIRSLPGLTTFLDTLKAEGYDRAIATSAPRENVDFTMDYTGVRPYFDTILDDTFVTRGKPDPEIYLKTADAVGYRPSECIVFEDSLAGIQAARSAGCKVIGITTTHPAAELAGKVDLSLENFTGILPSFLISRLF